MRESLIRIYVASMAALAVLCLMGLDWTVFQQLDRHHVVGFAVLTLLGILTEARALPLRVSAANAKSSLTFIPLLASLVLFGAAPAVAFVIAMGVVGEFAVRKKPFIRGLFNVSQWTVAATLGSMAFAAAGGRPLWLLGVSNAGFETTFLPFFVFGVVFLLVNHTTVSLVIAASESMAFGDVIRHVAGHSGRNILYDLVVSPVALFIAFLYHYFWIPGLLLTLIPLWLVRRAYQDKFELIDANRALLKVLIKAIETRDPYTSGHSLRVSGLARLIAERHGLGPKRVRQVETAALLHDIGKIEIIYQDILQKHGNLTEEERLIIESHVTKGVELLESLSSFESEVIALVRHHHEHYDGSGYPDRLQGSHIPLGARIIKICDAVDAMLSDRPYRKALPITEVYRQLHLYARIQFDPELVDLVIREQLIDAHHEEILSAEAERERDLESAGVGSDRRSSVARSGEGLESLSALSSSP